MPYAGAAAVQFECAGVVSLCVVVGRLLALLGSPPPSVEIFVRAVRSRCPLSVVLLSANRTAG